MSLCSWLVEGIGGKGSSVGLLPGSIQVLTKKLEYFEKLL